MKPVLLATLLVAAAACGGDPAGPDGGDGDGDTDADPGPDAAHVFDLAQLHTFDIEMAAADWEWLQANALLEEYRPGTVIFEGRRWENVGVRFKGGYGTLESCFQDGVLVCPKLSLKVKFNEYDSTMRFAGLRKLNFHSSVRDGSMMREVLSYHLFRSMGLPASRASHALVRVNGEPQGLFVLVEDVDKEFLQDHWGTADEGNLYKSVWPQFADAQPYIDALETNETAADVSRMLALQQAITQSSDGSFVADMAGKLDLPALARYLAVDRAVNNVDGIQGFYCYEEGVGVDGCYNANYYWYEVPGGPSQLVVWDVDYTLDSVNADLGREYQDPQPGGCQPIPFCEVYPDPECTTTDVWLLPAQCNRLYGLMHRATWDDYRTALRELADGPMSAGQIGPLVTAVTDKIRPAVAADDRGPGITAWEESLGWVEEVLAGQLTEIERLLAEP